jgi:hypothetical protein
VKKSGLDPYDILGSREREMDRLRNDNAALREKNVSQGEALDQKARTITALCEVLCVLVKYSSWGVNGSSNQGAHTTSKSAN